MVADNPWKTSCYAEWNNNLTQNAHHFQMGGAKLNWLEGLATRTTMS